MPAPIGPQWITGQGNNDEPLAAGCEQTSRTREHVCRLVVIIRHVFPSSGGNWEALERNVGYARDINSSTIGTYKFELRGNRVAAPR
jgi:hypothetical protein